MLFLIAIALAITAVVTAPSAVLETNVHIDAKPEAVWEVLTDAEAYQDWNPHIRSMTGHLEEGARITNVMQTPTGGQITFRPRILALTPMQELRWLGRLGIPRVFDGEHYFLLEPAGDGTLFTNGETFRGIALWWMSTEQFRESFEGMNWALKARVEATQP